MKKKVDGVFLFSNIRKEKKPQRKKNHREEKKMQRKEGAYLSIFFLSRRK
jgi:hypothetical protein